MSESATSSEPKPPQVAADPPPSPADSPPIPTPTPPRSGIGGRLAFAVVVLAALGGVAGAGAAGLFDARTALATLRDLAVRPSRPPVGAAPTLEEEVIETPWDGLVRLSQPAREAVGIRTVAVRPQTEPMGLDLLGTTAYDASTLTRVRPLFTGRADEVFTNAGDVVKRGDPLVELYSTELADAKNAYELKKTQWEYDEGLVENREALTKTGAVSELVFRETKNAERKSRRELDLARDDLLVFGLTPEEVEHVDVEEGAEKARMILRAPADGVVVTRLAVPGNLYDHDDTLMEIAELDHLWIWGNVFESDLELVELGQEWEVEFPYLNRKVMGEVAYITDHVDAVTHAVRIRTSVPNPDRRLKADMLVRGHLLIPPEEGRVVVPRDALVVADGAAYVFVRHDDDPGAFERRTVGVVYEKNSRAVLDSGVEPGEQVVSVGALILAQTYDDLRTVHAGARPAAE